MTKSLFAGRVLDSIKVIMEPYSRTQVALNSWCCTLIINALQSQMYCLVGWA